MRVLAIDQGTSGTKALVVDDAAPAGGVVALAEEPMHPQHGPGGAVEQDPAALLASVLAAGRRALGRAGGRVDAVALANQGETVLAWDRATGAPLSPALVWQDRRAQEVCAGAAEHADLVASRTGLVLDPYFSAPKMAWLRRHATREGVVTTTDTWLVHQLTGAFVTDTSTASRSLLLDLDTRGWADDLLDVFDLAGEELPELVDADAVVGATEAFGGPPVPVGGLVVDQAAALLAQDCREPGQVKCTFGTGAFLLANTGAAAPRSGAGLATSLAWTTSRGEVAHYLDGQVLTAGSAVRWLCDLGLLASAAELDAAAADDAAGVLCVPALAGLAAPWWRPAATASLVGMDLATRAGHVVRAVVDGIAVQVAELAACVEADLGAPLARLRVDGGLTASGVLGQAVADLTGVAVDVYPTPHATALGAAALGRMAVEPGLALADAVPAWSPARTHEPAWSRDRAGAFRDRWRAAAAAVVDRPAAAASR